MSNIKDIEKIEDLDELYINWWYTITGAGGNSEEWFKGYNNLLKKEGIGQIKSMLRFTGKDMNERYNLLGDNRYPDDLTFLAFDTDSLNISKLAMFKIQMNDRWFTDIVDNNSRRMEE